MWTGIGRHTKFKFSLEYKAVLKYTILYLVALLMIGPEFLKDPENKKINPLLEHNPMALDKIIVEV